MVFYFERGTRKSLRAVEMSLRLRTEEVTRIRSVCFNPAADLLMLHMWDVDQGGEEKKEGVFG